MLFRTGPPDLLGTPAKIAPSRQVMPGASGAAGSKPSSGDERPFDIPKLMLDHASHRKCLTPTSRRLATAEMRHCCYHKRRRACMQADGRARIRADSAERMRVCGRFSSRHSQHGQSSTWAPTMGSIPWEHAVGQLLCGAFVLQLPQIQLPQSMRPIHSFGVEF